MQCLIGVHTITKSTQDNYEPLMKHFKIMIAKYRKISQNDVFTKDIIKAQKHSPQEAQKSYTKALKPFFADFTIVLDPKGKSLNTQAFSALLEEQPKVNFFIGGAYGFEKELLKQSSFTIRLTDLTLPHRLAQVVLLEQIFRALCISHNHPYHK